jgi:hypothetical protein
MNFLALSEEKLKKFLRGELPRVDGARGEFEREKSPFLDLLGNSELEF